MKPLAILCTALLAATTAPAAIISVDTSTAGFVGLAAQGPLDQPVLVTGTADFDAVFGASTSGLANPYLGPSVAGFFANGGVRAYVVRVADADPLTLVGVDGGSPGTRTGLQALLDVDDVSIVAAPGVTDALVQTAMIQHCESAGDRMAILDPVAGGGQAGVLAQRAGLSTADGFAALYYPWIEAAPAGVSSWLPPSGFVAGAYSATSAHQSPVGVIATATGVADAVTNADQEILNPQGINAIRDLSGIRIWGARTLAADPEYRYVSVRRSVTCVRESVEEGTAWCAAATNDFALWSTLESDVDTYLHGLWQSGWLQGTTPNDAYFVRCDLSTMTATDLAEGRTIIQVGLAPQAPAEFIVFSVVHQRPQGTPAPRATAGAFLAPPAPNPCNPRTALAFMLDAAGRTELTVFDLRGRRVRTIVDGETLSAGEHSRSWDGRDGAGREAPSGVYLLRLRVGAGEFGRRLVLAR